MRVLKMTALAAAFTIAGVAHAQVSPGAPPPAPGPSSLPNNPEFRGPDEKAHDFLRMRDEVAGRRAGPTRSPHPVPVHPDDVTTGTKVRDSRGRLIGTIGAVGDGFAVVESEGGKIEVGFDSLAKNNKGLLINMTKAKFDDIVAGNRPPR